VHMTRLGAYYVALVTYAAIFRRSPQGAAVPTGVATAPAADMQRIAWDYVSAYYAQPNAGTHDMGECRTVISRDVCPTFHTVLNQTVQIATCRQRFADATYTNNPFRWPDPNMRVWPAP